MQDKDTPEELFGAYYMNLIERAKKARAENPDKTVAVAFAMYNKSQRDFIRKHSGEPVSFVEMEVKDQAEVTARLMPRIQAFIESSGATEEQIWNARKWNEKYGPFEGAKSWQKMFCAQDPFAGFRSAKGKDDKDVFFIDTGHKSANTIPSLEKELGLPHIENPDIEAVCKLNHDRAGESMVDGAAIKKAWKDDLEKRLQASAFLGGEAPSAEDDRTYMLLTSTFDKAGNMKYDPITEEQYPTVFKWIATMAEKKK